MLMACMYDGLHFSILSIPLTRLRSYTAKMKLFLQNNKATKAVYFVFLT